MNNNTKTKLCLFCGYLFSGTGFLYPVYKLLTLIPSFRGLILYTDFSKSHAVKADYIFMQWLTILIFSLALFLLTISKHSPFFNYMYITLFGLVFIVPLSNVIVNSYNLFSHNRAE